MTNIENSNLLNIQDKLYSDWYNNESFTEDKDTETLCVCFILFHAFELFTTETDLS